MTFAEYVKDFRFKNGLSTRKLGSLCALSSSTISQIQREINPYTGRPYDFKLETYIAIARGTGISVKELLSMIEDSPGPIDDSPSPQASASVPIADDEAYLLSLYRGMSDTGRALLVSSAQAFANLHPKKDTERKAT